MQVCFLLPEHLYLYAKLKGNSGFARSVIILFCATKRGEPDLEQRYISRELTHFVGRKLETDEDRYQLLIQVIKEGWLTHHPHDNPSALPKVTFKAGLLNSFKNNDLYNPDMVCFCDIPLADLSIHMGKYSKFGLAFDKQWLSSLGVRPITYIPLKNSEKVKDGETPIADHFEDMALLMERTIEYLNYSTIGPCHNPIWDNQYSPKEITNNLRKVRQFMIWHWFSYLQFFNDSLPDEDEDNYYFEREWRTINNINFRIEDIRRVILPRDYAKRFRSDIPDYFAELILSK